MQVRKFIVTVLWAAVCVIQAGADAGAVVSIETEQGKLRLTVQTEVGEYYQLQCRASLMSGAWENVGGEFLATASQKILTVEPELDRCMFRVIKSEPDILAPEPPSDPPSPPTE